MKQKSRHLRSLRSSPTAAEACQSDLLQQSSAFAVAFGAFVWGDYHGGGYLVVVVEVEELDAHGGSAGVADLLGVDADDLAELADDHHLRGFVDEGDAGDFALLRGGLHVDDALAAAGLEAVHVDVGAFAEAVLRDGEDEAGGEAELMVELFEPLAIASSERAGPASSPGSLSSMRWVAETASRGFRRGAFRPGP